MSAELVQPPAKKQRLVDELCEMTRIGIIENDDSLTAAEIDEAFNYIVGQAKFAAINGRSEVTVFTNQLKRRGK